MFCATRLAYSDLLREEQGQSLVLERKVSQTSASVLILLVLVVALLLWEMRIDQIVLN